MYFLDSHALGARDVCQGTGSFVLFSRLSPRTDSYLLLDSPLGGINQMDSWAALKDAMWPFFRHIFNQGSKL